MNLMSNPDVPDVEMREEYSSSNESSIMMTNNSDEFDTDDGSSYTDDEMGTESDDGIYFQSY